MRSLVWAIAYHRISNLQNSILIDPTFTLEISNWSKNARKFSLCSVQLLYNQTCNSKDRQIDYNILYLNCFRDYRQRGTQYRFGFSVVISVLVVESISRQWNIDISFIYLIFFLEKMNLVPNQTISAATLFEVFWRWIRKKKMLVVCLWSTCNRVTKSEYRSYSWEDLGFLLLCSNLACTISTSATKKNLKS